MTSQAEMKAALEPTCEALLRAAADDAGTILSAADAEADRQSAEARAEADRLLAEAREGGEHDARSEIETERRNAEREDRQLLLRAQRDVYEELGRRVRAAAQELRGAASYATLLKGLTSTVTERLGPEATVTEAPSGGVQGEQGARHLDLSFDALADRALVACAAEVSSLWQS